MIQQTWLWYQNSGLSHAVICVPAMEALALLALLTICLLFRITRPGLMLAYIFTYRWGLLFGEKYFAADTRLYNAFITGYVVFGILVLTLALVAMMIAARSNRQN